MTSRVRRVTGFPELIALYFHLFRECTGMDPVMNVRTGKAAKDILKAMPLEEAEQCLRAAFEDHWFRDNSRELWHVANNMNKYRRPVPPKPVEYRSEPKPRELIDSAELPEELSKRIGM